MPPSQMLSSRERWCCLRQCSVPIDRGWRALLRQSETLPGCGCGAVRDPSELILVLHWGAPYSSLWITQVNSTFLAAGGPHCA